MAGDNRSVDNESDMTVVCTAIDNDWGDDRPNMLMHPPCVCPRCAPVAPDEPDDDGSWLHIPGQQQRLRVERAELGMTGHSLLG